MFIMGGLVHIYWLKVIWILIFQNFTHFKFFASWFSCCNEVQMVALLYRLFCLATMSCWFLRFCRVGF